MDANCLHDGLYHPEVSSGDIALLLNLSLRLVIISRVFCFLQYNAKTQHVQFFVNVIF